MQQVLHAGVCETENNIEHQTQGYLFNTFYTAKETWTKSIVEINWHSNKKTADKA